MALALLAFALLLAPALTLSFESSRDVGKELRAAATRKRFGSRVQPSFTPNLHSLELLISRGHFYAINVANNVAGVSDGAPGAPEFELLRLNPREVALLASNAHGLSLADALSRSLRERYPESNTGSVTIRSLSSSNLALPRPHGAAADAAPRLPAAVPRWPHPCPLVLVPCNTSAAAYPNAPPAPTPRSRLAAGHTTRTHTQRTAGTDWRSAQTRMRPSRMWSRRARRASWRETCRRRTCTGADAGRCGGGRGCRPRVSAWFVGGRDGRSVVAARFVLSRIPQHHRYAAWCAGFGATTERTNTRAAVRRRLRSCSLSWTSSMPG